MLQRRKSYNAASLVEDVATDYEQYLVSRLLDHAYGRHSKHKLLLEKMLSGVKIDPLRVVEVEEGVYLVPSENIEGKFLTVFFIKTRIKLKRNYFCLRPLLPG